MDVFISYSSNDKNIADAVCHVLEQNDIQCWIAPRDVRPGERYALEIVRGIDLCRIVVLIYTHNSNKSEHVANEIDISFNKGKTIIPFLVEETPMNMEFTYYLSRKQWIIAYPNYTNKLNLLVKVLNDLLIENSPIRSKNCIDSELKEIKQTVKENLGSSLSAEEQYNIGYDYHLGRNGKPKDYGMAAKWYLLAANQGHAFAQYYLSLLYETGHGVPQSNTEAAYWMRKSAELGIVCAQLYIGEMYEDGIGVKRSNSEAIFWYRKAADQGDKDAQFNLGYMYVLGRGVIPNNEEAFYWFSKAAKQGHRFAQNNLGVMYDMGLGVNKNRTEALKWYRKAAEDELDVAKQNLANEVVCILRTRLQDIQYFKTK